MTATVSEDRIAQRAEVLRGKLEALRGELSARKSEPRATVPTSANDVMSNNQMVISNPERPKNLEELIGQDDAKLQLKVALSGAMLRGERMSHTLINGPAGYGKTSLAEIVGVELAADMIHTTGMLLRKSSDLVGLLVKIGPERPTVLWIDEVHACHRSAIETLYTVLEDGKIDILGRAGADMVATTHPLPNLVVVAATTRMGLLTQPFRDRFGLVLTLTDYSDSELAQIVAHFWRGQNVKFFKNEDLQVARRSRGVPRNAMNLAKKVLAFAAVSESPNLITSGMVAEAAQIFDIDANGLTGIDLKVLRALTTDFAGRAVGLDVLASHLDIDTKTLTENHEPFLSRQGLLIRSGRGRLATSAAYDLMRSETI